LVYKQQCTVRMIIDQANAAAELNGRFFNKTNRFESIRPKRISESIRIANRNALKQALSQRLKANIHITIFNALCQTPSTFTYTYNEGG